MMAVIALTAAVFTSCGYKSVEENLNDELILFTAKTDGDTIVYGVKDTIGNELLPARYNQISLYAGGILAQDQKGQWLYSLDGKLIFDEPSDYIIEDHGNLIFNTSSNIYRFIPANSSCVTPPLKSIEKHGSKYFFAQDIDGLDCVVYNEQGEQIVCGGRIIYLFSRADNKYYFVVLNNTETAIAFDENGNELFALDRQKMHKLPQAEWRDISVEKIVTKNKLESFKAHSKRKKH